MKKITFKEDILPHTIAIVVFLLITIIFYSPEVLDGKSIRQHDVLQGQGGGQEVKVFREASGEEALWTNSMFGGMPAYLINVKWSDQALLYVQNILTLWLSGSSGVTMLTLTCSYIMLLIFGVRPYLAIAGAIAYAFTSFNIISIQAGHIWKVRAIAYMPLVLGGVHLLFKSKNKFLGFALTALAIALEIKANHLQITYYLFLLLIFYGVNALIISIKNKEIPNLTKTAMWLILAAMIGIGSNLGRLWSTYEYSQFSTRGKSELNTNEKTVDGGLEKDYVFRWSSGMLESMTYMIPNFYGGASSELIANDRESKTVKALRRSNDQQMAQQLAQYSSGYWGEQPGTAPIYLGAIVCFLFVLGILIIEKKTSIWLISATAFSIILSWGKNFEIFNYLMFDYFPAYNKFRAVTMVVCVAVLCMVLLGSIAIERAFQTEWSKDFQKKLLIAFGITGGLCLLFIIAGGVLSFQRPFESQLPQWFLSALTSDRQNLLRGDAIRSLIFIALTGGVIFAILKGKLNSLTASFIIIGLITFDLAGVDKRYLNKSHFVRNPKKAYFAMTKADQAVKKDTEQNYRVLNLLNPWNDAKTSYHHSSIGGYHGAKMKRYQQLVDYCLGDEVNGVINKLKSGQVNEIGNFNVINMLNTKYFIFGSEENTILPNKGTAGNAWFASQIKEVNNPDEEIAATCELDDSKTAILDVSKFKLSNSEISSDGSIGLIDYKPNSLQYESISSTGGLAVFSEIYYSDGWKAYIDDEATDIIRVNFVLRGLEIPEGQHKVEFRFVPKTYTIGDSITMISSIMLISLFIGSVIFTLKKELK